MTTPKWFQCGFCFAQRLGLEPVHGDDPCPWKIAEVEATLAALASQQASYERQGFAMNDMTSMLKKMTGQDDD